MIDIRGGAKLRGLFCTQACSNGGIWPPTERKLLILCVREEQGVYLMCSLEEANGLPPPLSNWQRCLWSKPTAYPQMTHTPINLTLGKACIGDYVCLWREDLEYTHNIESIGSRSDVLAALLIRLAHEHRLPVLPPPIRQYLKFIPLF